MIRYSFEPAMQGVSEGEITDITLKCLYRRSVLCNEQKFQILLFLMVKSLLLLLLRSDIDNFSDRVLQVKERIGE